MANINTKIMGLPLKVVDDSTDIEANAAISVANEIYNEVVKEQEAAKVFDSSQIRAIAIFKIVMELQTIKGKNAGLLDTYNKRVEDLIKLVDSANLQN